MAEGTADVAVQEVITCRGAFRTSPRGGGHFDGASLTRDEDGGMSGERSHTDVAGGVLLDEVLSLCFDTSAAAELAKLAKNRQNFLRGKVGKARTCDAAENVPRKSGWTDRMECVRINAAVQEALLTAASEDNGLHAACA